MSPEGDDKNTRKERLTDRLTPREREVSRRLMLQNKEIAHALGLTPHTVRSMLKTIMRKTGIHNRTQIALAVREEERDGGSELPGQ